VQLHETQTQEDDEKITSPDHREAADSSILTFELHQAVVPDQNLQNDLKELFGE